MRGRPSFGGRVFRLLLRLFPAEFRGDFARDMEADFRDQREDARAGGRAAEARLWLSTVPGLFAAALRQHLDVLRRDAGYALRLMARRPGVSAAAVLMIALGTGANAAMFSVVDAVMLRSPFPQPDRLAIVLVEAAGRRSAAVSVEQFRSLLTAAPALESVGAIGSGLRPVLGGLGELRRMNVECITAMTFRVLGTPPLAGRTFAADDDRPGAPGVVVISYQFWQREMGGAADSIGRVITLNGTPATVVGIMPREFGGPHSRNNNDGWLPLGPALGGASAGCNGSGAVNLFARIRGDVPFAAAAEQATASAGIARIPDWRGRLGTRLALIPLQRQTTDDLRTPLFSLLGAVVLVLLIACANVANLQLERLSGRRRELAVRAAIGATRGRLVRLALTESLVLHALGCAAGLAAAHWTLGGIIALLPSNVPHLDTIAVNVRILAATIAVALGAGATVGLVPAWHASASSRTEDLRATAASSDRAGAWGRRSLVVTQLALSLVLLVGAALMLQSFLTLRPSSPGFDATDKLTGSLRLQGSAGASPAAYFHRFFERVRAIPGISGVSGSTYLPMSGTTMSATVASGERTIEVFTLAAVTPEYFGEMRIPIVRGRAFDAHDDESGAPVAVVNETLARRLWPDADPIGARIEVTRAGRRLMRHVVGVAADTRALGSELTSRTEIDVPFAQEPGPAIEVIVRTARPDDSRVATALRAAAAAEGEQVLDRLTPYEDLLDSRVAYWRLGAWLLGVFAGMALALAAIGLAASIGWWVSQRTTEIGVRMALGATPPHVTRMFLRQGLALALIGTLAGLAGAAMTTRLLQGWLFGVTPLDPVAFAASSAGILAIAAGASYLPARRASRIDPLVALRSD